MRRTLLTALVVGYVSLLLDLTLVRFRQPVAPPNLIPLETVVHYLHIGGWEMMVNLVGNLAAFVPLGLLVPALRGGRGNVLRAALLSLSLSLLIESLQYLSGSRIADVDDVLLNTLGGVLGSSSYLGLTWLGRIVRPRDPRRLCPVVVVRDQRP